MAPGAVMRQRIFMPRNGSSDTGPIRQGTSRGLPYGTSDTPCACGLMAAVEFVRDRDDRVFFDASENIGPRITAALLERGVIGRAMPQGGILGFAPPLCLTKDEADTIVTATKAAVESVTSTL